MKSRIVCATGVALLVTSTLAAPGAAAHRTAALGAAAHRSAATTGHGPRVSVRVEGLKKTRLLITTVSGRSGWITKGGTPKGQCPGKSAAGALDVATEHNWTGKWSAKYQALSVTGILGERHSFSSSAYWSVWVNNKYASSGVCGITLEKGEQLLFAAEPTKTTWFPTVLSAPHRAAAKHSFSVKLVGYSSSGRKPLKGVTITGNGITPVKTDHTGTATVTVRHSERLVLRASPKRFIRSEAVVHVSG
jgi:hypothetical protein